MSFYTTRRPATLTSTSAAELLSRDRLDEALDAYRIAEEQRSGDCKPPYGTGLTLYHLDRFEEAEVAYYRALELCPRYGKALTDLAGMRLDQGRSEVALRLSDSAIDVRASNVDAWVNRARALQHPRQRGRSSRLHRKGSRYRSIPSQRSGDPG